MNVLTHSISILVAALFACAILWGEHYHPWNPDRSMMDVRLNYVLGTIAMEFPFWILLLYWLQVPPAATIGGFVIWTVAGQLAINMLSGLAVWVMHENDKKLDYMARARSAENAEKKSRDTTQA